MELDLEDIRTRQELLAIARKSLESIYSEHAGDIEASVKRRFSEKSGAFTTIRINGNLRGCIGFVEPV
ncbi:MAG: AMMECR1 domain-containing protein, partial [Thermoplasmata archaeon]